MIVAPARAGLTPAIERELRKVSHKLSYRRSNVYSSIVIRPNSPVDLKMAPLIAAAAMPPAKSCSPRTASIVELTALYIKAISERVA